MKHRGLLHHMDIVVSNLPRAAAFYAPFLRFLGYELAGESARYQDWRRSDLDTPHEITLLGALPSLAAVSHTKGATGHHHHIAFAAEGRADVDRLFSEVLIPAAEKGLCKILDAPVECPEYGRGYYATFFEDPDGLKLEFVIHEEWLEAKQKKLPRRSTDPTSPPVTPPARQEARHPSPRIIRALGKKTMTRLLRFPGSARRDPAIETWMKQHAGELGAIAKHWFEVMRECGEDVRELMHDGHPTACVADAAFAYVNAFRAHVNVGFFRGAEIADPKGLLEGTGKHMRHMKLRPGGSFDSTALMKLINSAYVDMRKRVQLELLQAGSFGPPDGEEA